MIGCSLILILLAVLVIAGCKTSRSAYESAPYRVVRTAGQFEVRDYPPLTLVETSMNGPNQGADGSFNRLFTFITGGNASKQKIAMTTPVFMTSNESNATMAFVMPQKLNLSEVPQPLDSAVGVRELPPGRFAVLRFQGGRNARNEAAALQGLKDWMKTEGLSGLPPPVFAYFDPPWTPGFLRRNEVMLRTGAGKP